MLYALENQLAAALVDALPREVRVQTGPSEGPPPEGEERVELSASRLEVMLPEADVKAAREPSFLTQQQRWSADGTGRNFTLPAEVRGEVLEVESPPGRALRLGEDYQLDGATLRLYRPPAAATEAVVATVRTGAARGFQERRPCHARLTVSSWAADFPKADALLERALAVVLTGCAELETLEAGHLGTSGVRLRLREPVVTLAGLERTRAEAGTRRVPHTQALLRLEAWLELSVTLGAAKPEERIQGLRYVLTGAR